MTLGVWLFITYAVSVVLIIVTDFVIVGLKEPLGIPPEASAEVIFDYPILMTLLCGKIAVLFFSYIVGFASTYFLVQEREGSPLEYISYLLFFCCCCGGLVPFILIVRRMLTI